MKLLGLEVPEWAGPTLCESSGGDQDILPFGAWKKEVKIELKIEENKHAVPKKRKKKEQEGEINCKKDVKAEEETKEESKEAAFSDSRPIKMQKSTCEPHSLNGSTHNPTSSSSVNETVVEAQTDTEQPSS